MADEQGNLMIVEIIDDAEEYLILKGRHVVTKGQGTPYTVIAREAMRGIIAVGDTIQYEPGYADARDVSFFVRQCRP